MQKEKRAFLTHLRNRLFYLLCPIPQNACVYHCYQSYGCAFSYLDIAFAPFGLYTRTNDWRFRWQMVFNISPLKKFTRGTHSGIRDDWFWPFLTFLARASNAKKGVERQKFAQTGWFCAIIFTFFALFLVFLSTPFFKKATPYKNLALTFESQKSVFFSYSALTFFCSAV